MQLVYLFQINFLLVGDVEVTEFPGGRPLVVAWSPGQATAQPKVSSGGEPHTRRPSVNGDWATTSRLRLALFRWSVRRSRSARTDPSARDGRAGKRNNRCVRHHERLPLAERSPSAIRFPWGDSYHADVSREETAPLVTASIAELPQDRRVRRRSDAGRPAAACTAAMPPHRRGTTNKSAIMIYLPGGPSHMDMYDLKPDAPKEFRGEFKPIATNVPGVQICEHFPLQAKMWDKLASPLHRLRRRALRLAGHDRLQREHQPHAHHPSFGSVIPKLRGTAPTCRRSSACAA